MVAIDVAANKQRRRKVRPIGGIGPDLRFQADRIRLPVQPVPFAGNRAVAHVHLKEYAQADADFDTAIALGFNRSELVDVRAAALAENR